MADNINFRDKDAATVVTRATDNAGVKSIHHIIETLESGVPTPVGAAAPLPVSASSLPLPTGAATSADQTTGNNSLLSIDGKLPSALDGDRLKVILPSGGGGLTDAELRAAPVPVSASSLPLPSGAATSANQTTGNNSLSSIDGKLGTLGQKAMSGSAPVVLASDQSAIPVTPPAITKGTQGSTGFTTQDLKDAGRENIVFHIAGHGAGTSGNAQLLTVNKTAGISTSSGTSFVITNGKRFRITSISCGTRGHNTATAQSTTFHIRVNSAGAITTSSTSLLSQRSATPATANAWDRFSITIPDGFEIVGDGTLQIGFTSMSVFTTNAPTLDLIVTGFEY